MEALLYLCEAFLLLLILLRYSVQKKWEKKKPIATNEVHCKGKWEEGIAEKSTYQCLIYTVSWSTPELRSHVRMINTENTKPYIEYVGSISWYEGRHEI